MRAEDVRSVLVVVEEGSLRKAAARLGLSAASMSDTVRRVERALGARIFERSPKGSVLSAEGRELVEVMREFADAGANLERAASHLPNGRYVVGTILGYGANTVHHLHGQLPGGATTHLADHSDVTAGLRDGIAAAAILMGPTTLDADLQSMVVREEPFVAVLSDSFPHARQESITVEELDAIGWLRLKTDGLDPVWLAHYQCDALRGGPAPFRTPLVSRNFHELAIAAQNGHGVATAPMAVFRAAPFAGVVALPVVDGPRLRITVATRAGAWTDMADLLVESARVVPPTM